MLSLGFLLLFSKHFINHSLSYFYHIHAIFPRQLPQETRHTELCQEKARYHYRTVLYPETKALFSDQTGEWLVTTQNTNRAGRATRVNDNILMLYALAFQ